MTTISKLLLSLVLVVVGYAEARLGHNTNATRRELGATTDCDIAADGYSLYWNGVGSSENTAGAMKYKITKYNNPNRVLKMLSNGNVKFENDYSVSDDNYHWRISSGIRTSVPDVRMKFWNVGRQDWLRKGSVGSGSSTSSPYWKTLGVASAPHRCRRVKLKNFDGGWMNNRDNSGVNFEDTDSQGDAYRIVPAITDEVNCAREFGGWASSDNYDTMYTIALGSDPSKKLKMKSDGSVDLDDYDTANSPNRFHWQIKWSNDEGHNTVKFRNVHMDSWLQAGLFPGGSGDENNFFVIDYDKWSGRCDGDGTIIGFFDGSNDHREQWLTDDLAFDGWYKEAGSFKIHQANTEPPTAAPTQGASDDYFGRDVGYGDSYPVEPCVDDTATTTCECWWGTGSFMCTSDDYFGNDEDYGAYYPDNCVDDTARSHCECQYGTGNCFGPPPSS